MHYGLSFPLRRGVETESARVRKKVEKNLKKTLDIEKMFRLNGRLFHSGKGLLIKLIEGSEEVL